MKSEVEEVLRDFVEGAPGAVAGCALVRAGGFVECSVFPNEELKPIAVLGASAMGLARKAFDEMGRGRSVTAVFEGELGRVFLKDVGEAMMLVVFASKSAKLGMLFLEVERLSKAIQSLTK